jgi:hypothetical protein
MSQSVAALRSCASACAARRTTNHNRVRHRGVSLTRSTIYAMVLRVAAAALRLATVARVQRVDINGKIRMAAPALEAADRRVRALNEALAPGAMDYGYGICRRRVLYDGPGSPQLVVVGTQVGVPALVQAAPAIIDSGWSG